MSDDDLRGLVRNLHAFVAARFDSVEDHLATMEHAWANWSRDFGRRQASIEERLQSLEARVQAIEGGI